MFPRRFFSPKFFAKTYFAEGGSLSPTPPPQSIHVIDLRADQPSVKDLQVHAPTITNLTDV